MASSRYMALYHPCNIKDQSKHAILFHSITFDKKILKEKRIKVKK